MRYAITCKKLKKGSLLFFIGCCLFIVFQAPVFAADDTLTANDVGIKPLPNYEGSNDFKANAEKYYDFIGSVDDVHKEGIVVSDSYMKFAPGAQISGTRPGVRVGIRLNDAGEVVLCEPFKKTIGK